MTRPTTPIEALAPRAETVRALDRQSLAAAESAAAAVRDGFRAYGMDVTLPTVHALLIGASLERRALHDNPVHSRILEGIGYPGDKVSTITAAAIGVLARDVLEGVTS